MPRVCTVCTQEHRKAIDQALVNGDSFRDIAGRFTVSRSALERHKASHLPAALTKAAGAAEIAHADNLLGEMEKIQKTTLYILNVAGKSGDLRTALLAVGQARKNLELLARLTGELAEQQTTVNVLVASPDWLRLRSAILAALDPFPDARWAVLEALNDSR
jgi:hypothetical protein